MPEMEEKKPDPFDRNPPKRWERPPAPAPVVPASNPALDEMRRKTPADNIEEALNDGR